MRAQLVVLAKEPRAGHAKTRLSPALGPERAAQVARAALLDTLDAAAAVDVVRRTVLLDGSPAGWLPPGWDVRAQCTGTLGDRLQHAFSSAFAAAPVPVLLIGMDTPQVTPGCLTEALAALLGTDAVLGRAPDGGWWALGLHRDTTEVFDGVPMSTSGTGAAQQARLDALGLRTTPLPELRDVDHPADLAAVAAQLPVGSRTARLVAELAPCLSGRTGQADLHPGAAAGRLRQHHVAAVRPHRLAGDRQP